MGGMVVIIAATAWAVLGAVLSTYLAAARGRDALVWFVGQSRFLQRELKIEESTRSQKRAA